MLRTFMLPVCVVAFLFLNSLQAQVDFLSMKISSSLKEKFSTQKNRVDESWKSFYSEVNSDLVLKTKKHTFTLLKVSELQNLLNLSPSSQPRFLSADKNYVEGGEYPQRQPRFLQSSVTVVDRDNHITSVEKSLDCYFSSENHSVLRQLTSSGTKGWSVQNPRSLEVLLMNNIQPVVFMGVAGKWDEESRKGVLDVNLSHDGDVLPVVGGHSLRLVGFDHDGKFFIFQNCWDDSLSKEQYLRLSYDYVKAYAVYALYSDINQEVSSPVSISSAQISISFWKAGDGNFFRPDFRVKGSVEGSSSDIASLQLGVEYYKGRIIILREDSIQAGASFNVKDKYFRLNVLFGLVRVVNGSHKVTAFVRRRIH